MREKVRSGVALALGEALESWYAFDPTIAAIRYFKSKPLSANAFASSLSSSGWLGGLASLGSSIGSMIPWPKNWPHIRLTALRAKYGLSFAVIHSASVTRELTFSWNLGCFPSKYFAETVVLVSGIFSERTSIASTGARRMRMLSTGCRPAKNDAYSQNWLRFQVSNGWLWHWAHSIFTPRNNRDVAAATISGRNSLTIRNAVAFAWLYQVPS